MRATSCLECLQYVEILLGHVVKEKESSCPFGFEESAKTMKEFEKDLDEVLTASDKKVILKSGEVACTTRYVNTLFFTRTFFALIKALLQI